MDIYERYDLEQASRDASFFVGVSVTADREHLVTSNEMLRARCRKLYMQVIEAQLREAELAARVRALSQWL